MPATRKTNRFGFFTAALIALALSTGLAEAKVVHMTPKGEKSRIRGKQRSAAPLPAGLVIPPGRYEIGGRAYRLRKGAYRTPKGNRIAYKDPRSLLSGIAWLTKHEVGHRDDYLPARQLAAEMSTRRLHLSCGVVSNLAVLLLGQHGILARRVALVPEGPLGAGHTLLEVNIGGRWQVWDLDFGMRPLYRGEPIMAATYPSRVQHLTFDWIASDDWAEFGELPPAYKDVMGTALIEDGGYFYFTDPIAGHNRLELYEFSGTWYQYRPRAEFLAHFYPSP